MVCGLRLLVLEMAGGYVLCSSELVGEEVWTQADVKVDDIYTRVLNGLMELETTCQQHAVSVQQIGSEMPICCCCY
jgi:hypothetical protein